MQRGFFNSFFPSKAGIKVPPRDLLPGDIPGGAIPERITAAPVENREPRVPPPGAEPKKDAERLSSAGWFTAVTVLVAWPALLLWWAAAFAALAFLLYVFGVLLQAAFLSAGGALSGVGVLAHTIGSSFVVHGVLFAELLVALALSAAVGWFAMERMTGWFGATVTFVAGITCWAMALLLILLLFNVAPEGIPSAILRLWASAEALL